MKALWRFIRAPRNLAALGAVATVIAFLWTQVVAPQLDVKDEYDSSQKTSLTIRQEVRAARRGTAINAADNSTVVTISDELAELGQSEKHHSKGHSNGPMEQSATAADGGLAINASGRARVVTHQAPNQLP